MEATNDRSARRRGSHELLERFALIRLRRFARLAAVAEESGSPLWHDLAKHAARQAYRDYLLLGMGGPAGASFDRSPGPGRAA
jgi:hypothetical protein